MQRSGANTRTQTMNTLLHVVVVHHPDNSFGTQAVQVINRVFGSGTDGAPGGAGLNSSVWDAVRVAVVTDRASLDALRLGNNDRVLWMLLVDYPMTLQGTDWPAIMELIGQRLDAATQQADQSRVGAIFLAEQSALTRLPQSLLTLQGKSQALFGEPRIGPHRLGLFALSRARFILGRSPGQNKLKFFISHAKADGVFFADALNSAIKQVSEIDAWYDAEDIPTGTRWKQVLQEGASKNVFIAIRTEAYTQRPDCVDEFRWALENGMPIVVVDALLRQDISAALLPFAAMPTVRVADGNTHRVLIAALREHLRVLLVETSVAESAAVTAPGLPASAWRVWPRLPAYHALQEIVSRHDLSTPHCIVIADVSDPELNAAVSVLQSLRTSKGDPVPLMLATADYFPVYAVQFAAAFPPPAAPIS